MNAPAYRYGHAQRPRASAWGLGSVVLVHLLVLAALVQLNVVPLPTPLAVLSISLLPPMPDLKPRPSVEPPRPKPLERRPTPVQTPVPQLQAPAQAPSPAPAAVPPAPTSAPPSTPIAVPTAPAAQPTPPRFDADYLSNPRPPYPGLSRRAGEQGKVMLRVHVAADGSAAEVRLESSSGHSRLDEAALSTVRRWKFVPARFGQEAVSAWVLVPIAFTLKD